MDLLHCALVDAVVLWWQMSFSSERVGSSGDVHGSLSPALPLAAALNLQSTELRLLISVEYR